MYIKDIFVNIFNNATKMATPQKLTSQFCLSRFLVFSIPYLLIAFEYTLKVLVGKYSMPKYTILLYLLVRYRTVLQHFKLYAYSKFLLRQVSLVECLLSVLSSNFHYI